MDTPEHLRSEPDELAGELAASALLVLFALGSTALLLGTALGAVRLLA